MTAFRTLLAATALVAPGVALADAHGGAFADVTLAHGENYLAETLIGTRIHVTETEVDTATPLAAGAVGEFDDVGEIGDLVVGADGTLQAVVLDIGGFLGLGEREVAVNWSALVPVVEEDDPSEVFLVVNATREQLETAPELRRMEAEGVAMDATAETNTTDGETVVEPVTDEGVTVTTVEGDGAVVTTTEGDAETDLERDVEQAGEAVEDAAEGAAAATGEALQDAGEAVEDAAQATGDAVEDAAEATGNAVEDAAQEIEAEVDEAAVEAETGAEVEGEGTDAGTVLLNEEEAESN